MRAFKMIVSPRLLAWLLIAGLAISAVRCGEAEDIEEDYTDEEQEVKEPQAPPAAPPAYQAPPPPPPPPQPASNYAPPPAPIVAVPPKPPMTYEQPQQPVLVYEQQPQVVPNYSYPVIEQIVTYEQPAPVYQAPLPVPIPTYEPVQAVPVYQPIQSAPVYQPVQAVPAYQPPPMEVYAPVPVPVVNYSQPIVESYVPPPPPPPQPVYEQPPVANYSAPIVAAPPVYQKPTVVQPPAYQPPAYQPPAYQPPAYQPPAYQPPAYQPPSYNATAPAYQPPAYQPPSYNVTAPAYQAPAYQAPAYQPPSYNVTIPAYQPVKLPTYQPQQNYSKPAYVPQMPVYSSKPYSAPIGNYSAGKMPQIPYAQLVGMLPIAGLKNYTYVYLRDNQYRMCPKGPYGGPGPKDIEVAFVFAQQQMNIARNVQVQYMNATGPQASSWAARHQMFSFLSQTNARMDEEGLLYEIVSQYLANRICMSKYDKSRYLPSLAKLPINGANYLAPSCANIHQITPHSTKYCVQNKYRTYDGYCNNPYHPYWGKSNICHLRLLPPDYADGISTPRESYAGKYSLPNPRLISNLIHNDVPIEGPYNLMKMQWGQLINHDITNTGLSSYDGLVDCCRNPKVRGCWPIYIPQPDPFYGYHNVTCLSFIRSGVCPTCALGPRQQFNKNTAYLDASHIYGNSPDQARVLRVFARGLLKHTTGPNGEILPPLSTGGEQCSGSHICYTAGDNRINQHPALTVLHTLLLRSHNIHALNIGARHPGWTDELVFQEARRLMIAEYQMITYAEYLPIVFGPVLSAFYKLTPHYGPSYTYYDPKVDPTTWNEYSTAACRFGHSQIQGTFGLYKHLARVSHNDRSLPSFRLRDWFNRPSQLAEGLSSQILYGLLDRSAYAVDQWIDDDVRNHLYKAHTERTGGDLAATNIWRGRDHGIAGYIHYVEYCFGHKIRTWRDLAPFIPYYTLNTLKRLYRSPENVDLFTGGMSERHFPGADIGPTFACINGIQYYHLKFGDRYYFEHQGQAGSFTPHQLAEIKRTTLARFLCRTGGLQAVPVNAFLQPSPMNPIINCTQVGEIDYSKF